MNLPTSDATAEEKAALLDRALVSAFLDKFPDYIFFKDLQSRFVAVSKSVVKNFCGAREAQVLGRTNFDFFSAAYAQAADDEEQEIIRTGQPVLNRVVREIWLDGRTTWALTSKMPLRNDDGFITRKEGHSFGLRSAAVTAREMSGSIIALNDGPGRGASFIVELPITPATLPTGNLPGP